MLSLLLTAATPSSGEVGWKRSIFDKRSPFDNPTARRTLVEVRVNVRSEAPRAIKPSFEAPRDKFSLVPKFLV